MSIRGSARQHPPMPDRSSAPPFRSVRGMLRWHFRHGVVPGMDPSRDGSPTDAHGRAANDAVRASVVRCIGVLDGHRAAVIRLHYGEGVSESGLCDVFGVSGKTAGRWLNQAEGIIGTEARARGLVPG